MINLASNTLEDSEEVKVILKSKPVYKVEKHKKVAPTLQVSEEEASRKKELLSLTASLTVGTDGAGAAPQAVAVEDVATVEASGQQQDEQEQEIPFEQLSIDEQVSYFEKCIMLC